MHVPDGFLDPTVAGFFWLLSAVAIALAARRAREVLGGARTPLLGVVAASIFAAQMLNWPIPGGTSAHFVGGAFAGILLGPWLGVLAVSAVVVIQALVFGDGGVVTLGLNLWAMGVVDVVAGYALFRVVSGYDETVAAFVAGWGAITVASLFVAIGTGLSSAFAYELSVTIPVMVGGHVILGLVEGAITAMVYRYVATARPDLVLGRDRVVGGEVARAW